MNAIFKRRSIREYRDIRISDGELTVLLRAAMSAPSAGNCRPWEFIVVRDRESFRRITEFHPYSKMLLQADAAIVVCGNLKRNIYPRHYWILDCAAATENILIQATDMGIGSVWLAVYPEPDRVKGVKEVFSLPEEVIPLAIVSLGYPAEEIEEKKEPSRFKPERIHYERWQSS